MVSDTIDITKTEAEFLIQAGTDIGNKGKTDKKCPRCGNEIIAEIEGSIGIVKCKTPNCIKYSARGL